MRNQSSGATARSKDTASTFAAALSGSTVTGSAAGGTTKTSSTYDFSSMTRPQAREAINSLIKSGKMSLDESSSLVPIFGSLALNDAGTGAPSANYDTSPIDLFSMLRTAIAGAKSRHEDQNVAAYQQSLSALQRLQGTSSGVNMTA